MDQASFESKLTQDGYVEIQPGERPPNYRSEPHSHDFTASLLVLDGEISVTCEGETTTCRAGDTFTLEAGRSHSESVGPEGVRYIAGRNYR